MTVRNVLVALALSACPVALAQDSSPAQEPVVEAPAVSIQVSPSVVKSSIDRAVKHLRDVQAEDGSFADSTWITSQVLVALAECPREYRVVDGPFVTRAVAYLEAARTPTGLICDPRISANETRIRQTLLAGRAMAAVETRGYVEGDDAKLVALQEACKAVDATLYDIVQGNLVSEPRVLETTLVLELLASQGEDGNYGEARPGGVAYTIRQLTATWKDLRSKEVKAAAEVGVQKNVVDAVTPEAIGTAGTTAGALFGLGGHIIGDDQIAESGTGHVAASGAKTVCDVASSKAVDAAAQAGSSNLSGVMSTATSSSKFASSPLSAFVAALDGLVDVDNPAKLLTALTAGAHPGTVLAKTGGGGVDALVAAGQLATGNESAAMRSAELVEDKSVNGDYGAPAEAATKWTGIAMGDKEIMNKSTDDAAKQGRRGIWSAWGNAGADGMEAGYRGPTFRNADDVMRERYEFNPLDTSTWF